MYSTEVTLWVFLAAERSSSVLAVAFEDLFLPFY